MSLFLRRMISPASQVTSNPLFALTIFALFFLSASARAQTCQNLTGVPYATYVDAQGVTQELRLDLRIPNGAAGPTPLVIWVHGGGWSGGTRAMPARAADLCLRGYAVASIDYRLSGTAKWPAQIHDCKGALRWLRANATTYNLDPDRFGVWGSSAGGHLVAFLGTSGGQGSVTFGQTTVDLEGSTGGNLDRSSRVQAVVDWYGPTDFLQMRFYPSGLNHDAVSSAESQLLASATALPELPELAATANPISFISPEDPPFLLMHGTVDNVVPYHQSELLHRALLTRGVRTTFVPILEAGHGGGNFDAAATIQIVNDFFDANLLNLGTPTVSVTALDATIAENGGPAARFEVSRTGSVSAALGVRWVSVGTATLTTDITTASNLVTIPSGATSAIFTTSPIDDALIEGNESIRVALLQATTYRLNATQTSATTTLVDSESATGRPVVTLAAVDPVASEVGPDGGLLRLTRTGNTAAALAVNLRLAGTATSGADYSAIPTSATIPAGAATLDLAIIPAVDSLLEPTETAIVSINPAANYAVGSSAQASVRITERDQASTLPIFAAVAIDATAAEPGTDTGSFLFSRTGSTTAATTVAVVPGAGTSTFDGTDHALLAGTVTFPIGVNRVTVPLVPFDDRSAEKSELVTLAAAPTAGGLVGPTSAPVTLIDND